MFKRSSTTTDEPTVKQLDLLAEFKRIAEEQPIVLANLFRDTGAPEAFTPAYADLKLLLAGMYSAIVSRQGKLKRTFDTYQQEGIAERTALLRKRLEERLANEKASYRKERGQAQNEGRKVAEFDEETHRRLIDEQVRESAAAMRSAVERDMRRIVEELDTFVSTEVQQLGETYLLRFHVARERASRQLLKWQSTAEQKLETISPAAIDAMSDAQA